MNLQKMMKQAQEMQQRMGDMQERLNAHEVEGKSAGGLVTLRLNGRYHLLKVSIDESLLKPEEKEVIEDLMVAAYNDARDKIDSYTSEQMAALTGGLSLPPGLKLPF